MKTAFPHVILIPAIISLLLPTSEAQAFKCLPLYGNWCGPGHPSGLALPPVDGFDAACMRHDYCIDGPGPEAQCDRALVDELNLLASQVGYLPRPLQWGAVGGANWTLQLEASSPVPALSTAEPDAGTREGS